MVQVGNYEVTSKTAYKGPLHSVADYLSAAGAYDAMNCGLKWLKLLGGSPELIKNLDFYTRGCAVVRAIPSIRDLKNELVGIAQTKEPGSLNLVFRVMYKAMDAIAMNAYAIAFFVNGTAVQVGKVFKAGADFSQAGTHLTSIYKISHLKAEVVKQGLAPELCKALDQRRNWDIFKAIKGAGGFFAAVVSAPLSLAFSAASVTSNVIGHFQRDYAISSGQFAEYKFHAVKLATV